jgi:hypothetical protein
VASTLGDLAEERFSQLLDLGMYFEEFTHARSVPDNRKKSGRKADPK